MSTDTGLNPEVYEPQAGTFPVQVPQAQHGHARRRPTVVALVADGRNPEAERDAVRDRTLLGELVLTPTPGPRLLGLEGAETVTVQNDLAELERARVELAAYVLVVAPDGYVSPQTRDLITYASSIGRSVHFWGWVPDPLPPAGQ